MRARRGAVRMRVRLTSGMNRVRGRQQRGGACVSTMLGRALSAASKRQEEGRMGARIMPGAAGVDAGNRNGRNSGAEPGAGTRGLGGA